MEDSLRKEYRDKKEKIEERLREFKNLWLSGDHRKIFKEFVFCLLTPQSKAKVCWEAVERMESNGHLWKGTAKDIAQDLKGVRFKNQKAKYIVEAREKYLKDGKFYLVEVIEKLSPERARDFLVENVRGMGLKEASHFLRNIGFSQELAILDRHILKNLARLGVIESVPSSLARGKYLEIEGKMKDFSRKVKIPLSHLDLLFWSRESGKIFK